MQNLNESWLVLSRMIWGLWEIFTNALEVSELRLSMDPLAQSRKWVSLKFKGGLCVITMNNDAKFREELSCQFKISHEEFNDFHPSSQKSQKYSL